MLKEINESLWIDVDKIAIIYRSAEEVNSWEIYFHDDINKRAFVINNSDMQSLKKVLSQSNEYMPSTCL